MPIHRSIDINDISQADFEIIDHAVMRSAYATQNRFGRLFDERVYENDLASRLRAEGFEVHTQVPLKVSHSDFKKTFRFDLVVNNMPYEIKVVSSLVDAHKAQALNYAMLQNVRRIKLLNFGSPKVVGHLLRNAVPDSDRYQSTFHLDDWRSLSPTSEALVDRMRGLIRDWGTHLSTQLYNEALVHSFGGEQTCLQRMEIGTKDRALGTHLIQLLEQNHAFSITGLTTKQDLFRHHLETLLAHTSLNAIQWINLNRSRVEMRTLMQDGRGMGAAE